MRFLALIFLILIQSVCFAQDTVLIEIDAPKFKDGTIMKIVGENPFLRKSDNIQDLKVLNGKSKLKVATGNGDRFHLAFKEQSLDLRLEPGHVRINVPDTILRNAKVSGNKSNDQMDQWLEDWKKEPIYKSTYNAQEKWLGPGTAAEKAIYREKYDSIKVIFDQHMVSFNISRIRANPAAYINSTHLRRIMPLMPENQVSELYEELNAQAKGNLDGRFIKYNIDSLFINGTAPAFAQADTAGNLVKLADFRGKYLLLDFWASWCIPCREENPNMTKAYEQFKDRNFTILAVSLDSERKLWLDAVKKDKLLWAQLSDVKGWDSPITAKYAVKAVPYNLLISPDGKIIAKNLRGKALIETLEKLVR